MFWGENREKVEKRIKSISGMSLDQINLRTVTWSNQSQDRPPIESIPGPSSDRINPRTVPGSNLSQDRPWIESITGPSLDWINPGTVPGSNQSWDCPRIESIESIPGLSPDCGINPRTVPWIKSISGHSVCEVLMAHAEWLPGVWWRHFSTTCGFSGCHSLVAENRLHNPGVLGLIPGDCQPFHFPLWYLTTSNISSFPSRGKNSHSTAIDVVV